MKTESTKERLKNLIARSKEDELIQQLLVLAEHQPSDIADQIFSLSANYNNYKKDIAFGTLSEESKRVTSNDLNRRMLMVINRLEEVGDREETSSTSASTSEVKGASANFSSSKKTMLFGVVVLILVAFGSVFWLSKSNARADQPKMAEVWLGTWEQQIEASAKSTNSGTLTFKKTDGGLMGKAQIKHRNGSFTTMTLYNINLNERNKSIKGLWQSEDLDAKGAFEFSLRNRSAFKGSYTVDPDYENSFFWNGSR